MTKNISIKSYLNLNINLVIITMFVNENIH